MASPEVVGMLLFIAADEGDVTSIARTLDLLPLANLLVCDHLSPLQLLRTPARSTPEHGIDARDDLAPTDLVVLGHRIEWEDMKALFTRMVAVFADPEVRPHAGQRKRLGTSVGLEMAVLYLDFTFFTEMYCQLSHAADPFAEVAVRRCDRIRVELAFFRCAK